MSVSEQNRSANMAGKIDLAFGTDGVVNINVPGTLSADVSGVINGPDNTLYVCGSAQDQRGSKFFIAALSSTGQLIIDFGNNGFVVGLFGEEGQSSYCTQLFLSGEKLLLVGASDIGKDPFPALARLDLQGVFDPTFGEDGRGRIIFHLPGPNGLAEQKKTIAQAANSPLRKGNTHEGSATVLQNGKILLSHYFFRPNEPSYGLILRTLENGTLDTDFCQTGYLPVIAPGYDNGQTQIQSVTVDSVGRYVACGGVYDLGTSPVSTFFARYSDEGTPDTSFGPQGFRIMHDPEVIPGGSRAITLIGLDSQGFLSCGSSVHDPYVGQLRMLKNNGEPDNDFNFGEPLNTKLVESSTLWKAITRQSDGNFIVVGAIDKRKDTFKFDLVVARFDKTGKLDADFNDGLGWARTRLSTGSDAGFVVILQNEKIVVGGVSHNNGIVARYHC
ncbi:hypothetical protein IAI51_08800 [Pseudomonas sp. N40(2020)]|uniref:hypothetical protein n=1 Tax=Pseudomonas sp. N40(2020) TaxID=2767798 RepID=UPI00165694AC|nr:hypothetical protein [Pseudomonas sp. N40(2020)]MBC8996621.1 hypothetical protein [Pseudomonas sp. N40(2020)]